MRRALGDLDQTLVATSALADERTLTLTEGYLLARIDGIASMRHVLELVPLDPAEVERTLLGLLLTGRVETRPAPKPLPRRGARCRSPRRSEALEPRGPAGPRARGGERRDRGGGDRDGRAAALGSGERGSAGGGEGAGARRRRPTARANAASDPVGRRSTADGRIDGRAPARNRRGVPVASAQAEPLRGARRRAGLQRRRGEARLHHAHQAVPPGRQPRQAPARPARHARGDHHPGRRGLGSDRRGEEPRLLREPARGSCGEQPGRVGWNEAPGTRPARCRQVEPGGYVPPDEILFRARRLLRRRATGTRSRSSSRRCPRWSRAASSTADA